jgi:uroporphyrinogen decarboxylase
VTKREVVRDALRGGRPPYVPWSFRFTREARATLAAHFGTPDVETAAGNHILELGSDIGFFEVVGRDLYRDAFGVVWDRSVDKDIGNVTGPVLPGPSLKGFVFPDPLDPRFFDGIPRAIGRHPDRFRLYCIGFSLFERAWTLRGLENLLADFVENPRFIRDIFASIAEYQAAQVRKALTFDIDAVYFGDDWGQQSGLLMGYRHWKAFVCPALETMFKPVAEAGKDIFLHACGDVDELFDDLIGIGLTCFNPFQPEVMDVEALLDRYRGRLSFWGGLSTQRTLPFGSASDVRRASNALLVHGAGGGYIFSPAHAVEGDVPLANMLAFFDAARSQSGYRGADAGKESRK